jgi:RNA polymerase sigma factor (sigma-70 family)
MTMNSALTSTTASAELVVQYQIGDEHALERLWARYLPRLRRWAHGRLPRLGDNTADTDDLVQEAFLRSIVHLRTLEPRGAQSVFAYFKTIVLNQVRDYVRQCGRRRVTPLGDGDDRRADDPSPLEEILGRELLERYQQALVTLSADDQDVVLAVVELGLSDAEVAELFEKPSVAAARMSRGRALGRLGRAMEAAAGPSAPR